MENKRLKDFFIYFLYFLLFILLSMANLGESISPFSLAFLFALIYLNRNEYVLSPLFVLAYCLVNPFLMSVFIAFFAGTVAILVKLFHKIIKKKMHLGLMMLYLLLSQAVFFSYNIFDANVILNCVASLILSVMFCYICVCAFSAFFTRGIYVRFAFDENICLSLIVAVCALGLFDVYVYNVWILTSILVFGVLFLTYTLGSNYALYFATMCGLGVCFANNSIVPLANFVAISIVAIALKDGGKWFCSLAIILADFIIGVFLNGYAVYNHFNMVAVFVGCLVYCCIPCKTIKKFVTYVGNNKVEYSENVLLYNSNKTIKQKLTNSSSIFYCLSDSYKKLVSGNITKQEACEAMKIDIKNKVCEKCELCGDCVQNSMKNIEENLQLLCVSALEKGRVSIVDIPPMLSTYCNKLNGVLNLINEDAKQYKNFCAKMKEENRVKLDMCEQFYETGYILSSLANSLAENESRNEKFEKQIIEELLFYDVLAKECYVFEGRSGIGSVCLVIRNAVSNDNYISNVLKTVLKNNFKLEKKEYAKFSGWSVLSYTLAPKFDLVVGMSKMAKGVGVSGDNAMVIPISQYKTMATLCDGMGSGVDAKEVSTVALSIIENFYKAGFGSEFIINNVNKFLNYSNREIFTSADICVIDRLKAHADFIKMGSSVGIIKKMNTCKIIAPQNLPIGIVEKVKLDIHKAVLEVGDIIVLASDGVVDSFSSAENYASFVNNIRLINAQMIADNILEQAKFNYCSHNKDDLSVIVIRLISCA